MDECRSHMRGYDDHSGISYLVGDQPPEYSRPGTLLYLDYLTTASQLIVSKHRPSCWGLVADASGEDYKSVRSEEVKMPLCLYPPCLALLIDFAVPFVTVVRWADLAFVDKMTPLSPTT
jgi:hypothetical protein